MRELTQDEQLLIAGGWGNDSKKERSWWNDAFDWLSDSLGWMDTLVPGWLGNYLGGFGDVADSMNGTGDLIWDRANGYNDYVIEHSVEGEGDTMTFEEWSNAQNEPDGEGGP